MKTEKDDGLDDLFKKGIGDPVNEHSFKESDWEAMEQMLVKPKKPAIVFWLSVLGSVAALLLLFLGYLILKSDIIKPGKNEQIVAAPYPKPNTGNPEKNYTGISGGPIRQATDSGKRKDTVANFANNPGEFSHGQKGKSFFTLSGEGRRKTTGPGTKNLTVGSNTSTTAQNNLILITLYNQPVTANNAATDKTNSGITINPKNPVAIDSHKDSIVVNNLATSADHKNVGITGDNKNSGITEDHKNAGTADANAVQKSTLASNALPSTTITPASKVKGLPRPGRTVFAVTVLASSDLNGVNSSFQQSKVGGNFGALFSATFNKRWTISTGAQYDIKPYLTNFDNYHTAYQFKEAPASVNANCRMLEIPLNVNYRVYSIHGNKVTLGTGLSSYFMLREDYKFNYADYNSGPASYTVINKNRNILSVLNLDATYEHQINSKVGITLQPYLKLPLTDVGYSEVRLQSSGVALGLNWNLNTSPKPK